MCIENPIESIEKHFWNHRKEPQYTSYYHSGKMWH